MLDNPGLAPMNIDGLSAAPTLPRRAIIVTEQIVGASALAAGFDHTDVLSPDEFGRLDGAQLAGPEPTCIVISGVSLDGGTLAAVLARAVDLAGDAGPVVIDGTDPVLWPSLTANPDQLAGLVPTGQAQLAGRPCVVFQRGSDGEVPSMDELVETLPIGSQGEAGSAAGAESTLEVTALRARLDEVSQQLALAHAELASTQVQASGKASATAAAPSGGASGSSRRRLVKLAGAAGAALIVVGLVSAGFAWLAGIGVNGALITATLIVLLGGLAYLVRGMRRIGRSTAKMQRGVRRIATVQRDQDRQAQRRQESIERKVALVSATVVDTSRTLAELNRQFEDFRKATARQSVQAAHQSQAMHNLFGLLPVNGIVPMMGGWAASPDVLVLLVDELLKLRPKLVVECGSGVSTLWLSLTIAKFGLDTRIVALEHDERFAELTRDALVRHGVAHIAEVRHAPLTDPGLPGHSTGWYDRAALEDLSEIGLVFVDGPPESTGPRVRYPALPLLRDRFADTVTIVLDDLIRESEREIAAAWEQEMPELTVERLTLEKGAAVLRRG